MAKKRLAVHGKYEYVEKSVEELNLDKVIYGEHAVFLVNAFTEVYLRTYPWLMKM